MTLSTSTTARNEWVRLNCQGEKVPFGPLPGLTGLRTGNVLQTKLCWAGLGHQRLFELMWTPRGRAEFFCENHEA